MDRVSIDIVIEELEEKGRSIPAEVVRGLKEENEQLQKENEELKTAFGLVRTAANIFKKLYEEKGRE